MGIINDDFLLTSKTAKHLYHDFAENMPIIDYHCHIWPERMAKNYQFRDAYELFLGRDHYKWRQLRTFGIDEEYITGDRDPFEKWMGFAKVFPYLIGNPLYHWTSLEFKRYFDIDVPFTEKTAKEIWDICNEKLAQDDFRAKSLITRSNVELICTTDDPADDLRFHKQLKEDGFSTKVFPTFRPDVAVNIDKEGFEEYLKDNGITSYDGLIAWLKGRIEFFHENGGRISDHAMDYVPFALGNASAVFDKKLAGGALTTEEIDVYKTAVISECAFEYAKRGWAMQLHIGAMRNNNTRMFKKLGLDSGFDSVNDLCIAEKLSAFLNYLEQANALPKTILYTLNPKDNYVLGTILGCFQAGPTRGKIQFGSAWWFNDSIDGMTQHLVALGNLGTLGTFIGMLTDSRSFVSYPRHEYFRRILCNLIGTWVDRGEYPNDDEALEKIIKGICCDNAREYFGF